MEIGKVKTLHIYPIKSCGGLSLNRMEVDELGPMFDRRWVLVDQNGLFTSQRKLPQMALIQPTIEKDRLVVTAPGSGEIEIPYQTTGSYKEITVWDDNVQALDCGKNVHQWFSDFLGTPLRLFCLDPDKPRESDKGLGFQTAFADDAPFLITSLSSLNDLNQRMDSPLPMSRFRPNIVIENNTPFAEDGWQFFQIGTVAFAEPTPCDRCTITTVDQDTGTVTGKEPLAALSQFRKSPNGGVSFGIRVSHSAPGEIALGDEVISLS